MKARFVVLAGVVCLATGVLVGSPEEQTTKGKGALTFDVVYSALERLEQRVEMRAVRLEQRVEKLEKNCAALTAQLTAPPDTPLVPLMPGLAEPVPKGWKRKKFNGMYYYTLLLDSHGR